MRDRRMAWFGIARGAAAITLALGVATIFIFLSSETPWTALRYLLIGPLVTFRDTGISFNAQYLYQILAAMIPITFTGLAVTVMFSANQFNLAGEGCVLTGGFIGGILGVYLNINSGWHAVVAVLIATLACGLVMLIPALLKVKLGASEMVTSLMLNFILLNLVNHYLNFQFADRSKGATMTKPFQPTAIIPSLVPGNSKLTVGFIAAMAATALVAFFLYRTRWGYAIRMIGINESFALYSGMNVGGTIILSQVIGGMLSGMGGSLEVLGRYQTYLWRDLPGYGWVGITIAILAKNNPAFVPLAAFFIAYLNKGCLLMSTYCDVPVEMIDIIQAAIFLFFAAEQFLSGYRQKLVVKTTQEDLMKLDASLLNGGENHA
ncbi:MAG TPA: ABC transporter permease [Clostridiaceae bacterium]|nr:ABC transporter permease [Clostridiaceae bacterium]